MANYPKRYSAFSAANLSFKKRSAWPSTTNPPVNFAHLSTGENGDSEAESLASNANPRGSCFTPAAQSSKRRLRADNCLQNVWDKGPVRKRCCQPGRRSGWTYRTVAPHRGRVSNFHSLPEPRDKIRALADSATCGHMTIPLRVGGSYGFSPPSLRFRDWPGACLAVRRKR